MGDYVWFRMKSDVINNAKIWKNLSSDEFRIWVGLCAIANMKGRNDDTHETLEDCSFLLREDISLTVESLIKKNCVSIDPKTSTLIVHNFTEHNPPSDSSSMRTRNYRERLKESNVTVTTPVTKVKRHSDAIEENRIEKKRILISKEISSEIHSIFSHWKMRMNHPTAKLDEKRKKLISKALALKYTPEQLITAIDGCASDAWHMGKDPKNQTVFDGLGLIFRDAEHIDNFIKLKNFKPTEGSTYASNGNASKSSSFENAINQRARAKLQQANQENSN